MRRRPKESGSRTTAALLGALHGQEPTVGATVVVVEEGGLAVVAPLCEVVWFTHRDHPRESGIRLAILWEPQLWDAQR